MNSSINSEEPQDMLEASCEFVVSEQAFKRHYGAHTFYSLRERAARARPDINQSFWSVGEVATVPFAELEDIFAHMPEVMEVAAFPLPHERIGESVCGAADLRSGDALSIESGRAFFRTSGVTRQETHERLELLPSLPRTPSENIRKVDHRKQCSQRPARR